MWEMVKVYKCKYKQDYLNWLLVDNKFEINTDGYK